MLFVMSKLEKILSGELDDTKIAVALEIFGKHYGRYDTKEMSERLAKGDYGYVLEKLNAFANREKDFIEDMKHNMEHDYGVHNIMFGSYGGTSMMTPTQIMLSRDHRLLDASRIMIEYFEKKEK